MNQMNTLSIIASLAFLASCNPADFDDIASTTWVNSASQGSHEFLALVPSGGGDVQYLAITKTAVFQIGFKENHKRVASSAHNLEDGGPLQSMPAIAVDSTGYTNDKTGNIAIGTVGTSGPSISMFSGQTGEMKATRFELEGSSAQVAPTGIGFASDTLFAVSGTWLNLFADYKSAGAESVPPTETCSLDTDAKALLLAELDDSKAGMELLVAIGDEIRIIDSSNITEQDTLKGQECEDKPAITGDGKSSFGSYLTQGDFDKNGETDIVVSAPTENSVYVYMNWKVSSPTKGIKVSTPKSSEQFGASIAVGDLNGDGSDELIVGDPQRKIASHKNAGKVYIFELQSNKKFAAPVVLHDARAQDDQYFGQSLSAVPGFGADRLIVGAKNEIFTYFRTPLEGDTGF